MKLIAAFLVFMTLIIGVMAAEPTDIELQASRAQAAEAGNHYLELVIQRMQASEQKTAKWWAEYIGLDKESKHSEVPAQSVPVGKSK